MSAVPAIHHETLMRFRMQHYVTPRWRVAERERIAKLIALANGKGIKPRIIVQAETRKSA